MAAKAWKDMTPEEKRAWRIDRWRNPDIEFESPEAKADYQARVDRLIAALELRVPDRAPISLNTGFWPALSAGLIWQRWASDGSAASEV
jgi:hypothetical protein